MPINRSLAHRLIEYYGYEEGKRIYHAMESEHSKAFEEGMKTATKEKHLNKVFPRRKRKKKEK
jgi:hypothetical protein